MKSSIAFLLATVVLAVSGTTVDSRAPHHGGAHNGGGNNHNNGGGNSANNNNGAGASASATTTASNAGASVAANNGNNGGNNNNNNNGGNNNSGNIQDSLTLDPSVICTACTDDGQNPPVAGQSASLTSSNNFINFCQGKTLTNGQQLVDGSCNGVVLGDIIPQTSMPAAKIAFPPNGGTFPANQDFSIKMFIKNMVTGNFVNAQTNYYGAPQQLQNGLVVGHTHITVQALSAIDSTDALDPTVFAFFKGVNQAANGDGSLLVDVAAGLPAGAYRFCTINTNANHTPALVAVAQHGTLDDCTYATAVDNGNGGNNNGGNNASATSAAVADASTTAAAAATSSAAAGGNGNKNGGGRHRGGQGRGRGGRGRRPHHQ